MTITGWGVDRNYIDIVTVNVHVYKTIYAIQQFYIYLDPLFCHFLGPNCHLEARTSVSPRGGVLGGTAGRWFDAYGAQNNLKIGSR